MILLDYTLKAFDWNVKVIYCDEPFKYRKLISLLEDIGCTEKMIDDALFYCDKCLSDCGMTYSNSSTRETIIIIFKCSSVKLFYNTLVHELYHFICQVKTTEYSSEEDWATLIGNMFMDIDISLKDLI